MKLVSVNQMHELENKANEAGLSYETMMERAGNGLAGVIEQRFVMLKNDRSVIGLVGPGNNGGDTLIALDALQKNNWQTIAYVYHRDVKNDPLIRNYLQDNGLVEKIEGADLVDLFSTPAIILDGLLGTGLKLPVKTEIKTLLSRLKSSIQAERDRMVCVAVDCPSGLDCETGEGSELVIPADITVCMAAVKNGLVSGNALGVTGDLTTVSIGLDQTLPGWDKDLPDVVDEQYMSAILPDRPSSGHKGTFGSVMVVGGMINYCGAPLLAGRAAYAVGSGLVQLAVPESLHHILAGQLLEAVWLLLPENRGSISADAAAIIHGHMEKMDAMLVGPGIGLDESVKRFMQHLFQVEPEKTRTGFMPSSSPRKKMSPIRLPKLVIDADGLKCLAEIPSWWKIIPENAVLTPHPGEMAVLTGLSIQEIQANRLDIAQEYAKKWGQVIVLKGAGTIIAAPDKRTAIIPIASTALAHAGTGDALAGMILGLLGQGMEAYPAATAGAWIHARSGVLAAQRKGSSASVLAADVIDAVGFVLHPIWK
jgi:ADP-dependent NAD(P)H-hydrate dehydratase / NAD(P)H-hydrate epimerase